MAHERSIVPPLLVRTNGTERQLDSGTEYRIGSDPAADIVLTDRGVSWRHATLRVDGQRWVLEDQDGSNGIYIAGERTDRVDIQSNRVVRLGNPKDGPELRLEPQLRQSAPPEPELTPTRPDDSDLPSVDRRPTDRVQLFDKEVRIGRSPDNNLVVDDLTVSRHHAVLTKSHSGRYQIFDLDSYNGTYVNGARVQQAEVSERDIIAIGPATFRLTDGELKRWDDTGDVPFEARDLTVVEGGKTRLDDVSFPVEGGKLVAVIGPSGAGKSTLIKALTGTRRADGGQVLYDSRDLYRDFAELRHRIGYVPQEDIVHALLTPRAALGYAAKLRFASDTSEADRLSRVDEVLEQLRLTKSADTRTGKLSGGQQKRVNVALELLTKPSLLFLDEPTSGLDPGLDADLMDYMQHMAHDEGRTIIVTTHSMDNLDRCDRLLVLVPGGKVAYYGPPKDALAYFGQVRWAEVFRAFDAHPDRDWAGEFRQSEECAQYVTGPMMVRPPRARLPGQPERARPSPSPPGRGRARQVRTLTGRYMRLIWADRTYLLLVLVAPWVLGVVVRSVSLGGNTTGAPKQNMINGPQPVLIALIFTACLAAVVNSMREVVKEREIYNRERAAGLSPAAYLGSKVLVLGVIAVYQAVVMVPIGIPQSVLPRTALFLRHPPKVEVILAVALLEFALTCLGLLVSALLRTSESAMMMIPLIAMTQVVFSGAFFSPVSFKPFFVLTWFAVAGWGMAAIASTAGLNVPEPHKGTDPLWNYSRHIWLSDMGMMLVWAAVYLLFAWWLLNRQSAGRRGQQRGQFARRILRSAIGR